MFHQSKLAYLISSGLEIKYFWPQLILQMIEQILLKSSLIIWSRVKTAFQIIISAFVK